MKKGLKNKKIQGLLALLLCLSLAIPAVRVQAASEKSQAIMAYKQYLSSKENNGSFDFAMIYLDNDSVPELLVGGVNLYTFEDGAMVHHSATFGDSGYGYYKKKGVFVSMHTHFNVFDRSAYENWDYSKFAKSTITKKLFRDCVYKTNSSGKVAGKKKYTYSKYNTKGTTVKTSKSKFRSILKQMVGKEKMTKIQMHHNTSANRNQYLK